MRRGAAAGMVLGSLLLLGACGGGDDSSADPSASVTTPTAPAVTTPAPTNLEGAPAPEALSRFRCEQVSGGWAAAGYLSNTGKQKATFQVTVYIGPADGGVRQAATTRVADVAAGASVQFRVDSVPVAGEGECHVQVLRSDG